MLLRSLNDKNVISSVCTTKIKNCATDIFISEFNFLLMTFFLVFLLFFRRFIQLDSCRIKLYKQKDNISHVYKLARGQVL